MSGISLFFGFTILELTVALALIVVLVGLWLALAGNRGGAVSRMVTDRGRRVTGNTPKPTDPAAPLTPTATERGSRIFVRRAADDYNCLGFTFGRRLWEIEDGEIDLILADNYDPVEDGAIQVCCIIVWRENGAFYHVGLVVEANQGHVAKVRSKSASSDYVFDHLPNDAPYTTPYTIYRRRSTAGLGPREQKILQQCQAAYGAHADKTTSAARDDAELLCQAQNGLINS